MRLFFLVILSIVITFLTGCVPPKVYIDSMDRLCRERLPEKLYDSSLIINGCEASIGRAMEPDVHYKVTRQRLEDVQDAQAGEEQGDLHFTGKKECRQVLTVDFTNTDFRKFAPPGNFVSDVIVVLEYTPVGGSNDGGMTKQGDRIPVTTYSFTPERAFLHIDPRKNIRKDDFCLKGMEGIDNIHLMLALTIESQSSSQQMWLTVPGFMNPIWRFDGIPGMSLNRNGQVYDISFVEKRSETPSSHIEMESVPMEFTIELDFN